MSVPPQSCDAEQAALGAALISRSGVDWLLSALLREDFYLEPHRKIYDAIGCLAEKGLPVEPFSVAETLGRHGCLEACGGISYVAGLTEALATAASAEYYCRTVAGKAGLRRLIDAAAEISAIAYGEELDPEEAQDAAERLILAAAARRNGALWVSAADGFRTASDRIVMAGQKPAGIGTGFHGLDTLLMGGFQDTDLVMVAARPGVGKTALLGHLQRHCAEHSGPAAVFSLEMSEPQFRDRQLAAESRVSLARLRAGVTALSDEEWRCVSRASDRLGTLPMPVCDQGELTIQQLRAEARRLKRELGVRLFLVDYLQRVPVGHAVRPESRNQEVAYVARSLKSMAKELSVPVVVVSSLSRPAKGREKEPPRLSELRDSGELEFEADIVLVMHRASVAEGDRQPQALDPADLIFEKHRNGALGKVTIGFRPATASFEDMEERYEPPEDDRRYGE